MVWHLNPYSVRAVDTLGDVGVVERFTFGWHMQTVASRCLSWWKHHLLGVESEVRRLRHVARLHRCALCVLLWGHRCILSVRSCGNVTRLFDGNAAG